MTAIATQSPLRSQHISQPSPRDIRRAAARIRRTWSPIEREFRREVGQVQRLRLVATLVRSAA
jgi:hypothetical protein